MSGKLSKNQAKKAGEFLAKCVNPFGEEASFARSVVDEWREAHKEVFLEAPETLKDISYSIDSRAVVVGRLKRMDTIVGKLRRPGLNMKLNEMCDIVGCRVIASDIEAVRQISAAIENRLNVKPETGVKDYIAHPKLNGYRSTHVISRHDAPEAGLTNLFCETQVRTRLQHAWATALETYDVMSRNTLKFGGGSEKEKRLFALISNAFAIKEGSPLVPETPASRGELRREIASLNNELFVIEKLRACSDSVTIVPRRGNFSGDALCLMVIDYEIQKTDLFVYDTVDEVEANQMYAKSERMKKGLQDVLLVRVASLKALNEAYPNYSMDIARFLAEVDEFLCEGR